MLPYMELRKVSVYANCEVWTITKASSTFLTAHGELVHWSLVAWWRGCLDESHYIPLFCWMHSRPLWIRWSKILFNWAVRRLPILCCQMWQNCQRILLISHGNFSRRLIETLVISTPDFSVNLPPTFRVHFLTTQFPLICQLKSMGGGAQKVSHPWRTLFVVDEPRNEAEKVRRGIQNVEKFVSSSLP